MTLLIEKTIPGVALTIQTDASITVANEATETLPVTSDKTSKVLST